MIRFDEIDARLAVLGLDRAWLAENSPYSADYIRTVLAPKSTRRTDRVMQILSDAIEREEAARHARASEPDENLIRVSFNDEDFAVIESAAGIVQTPIKDFITRAAIHQARAKVEESAGTQSPPPLTVTEGGEPEPKTGTAE